MLTERDLAWMAGVIDLKGRIAIKKNQTRRTLQYTWSVQTQELLVVSRLCELSGTQPEVRPNTPLSDIVRRNCMEHCPEAHTHVEYPWNMPNSRRWTTTGAGFVIQYHNLRPFLIIDRGYQDVIQNILASPAVTDRGSGQVLKTALRLQTMGWAIPEPYASALENKVIASLEEAA